MAKTRYYFLAILISISLACEKESVEPDVNSYLNKWTGTYEGTAYFNESYPILGPNPRLFDTTFSKEVTIRVIKAKTDSAVDIAFVYNTNTDMLKNIKISSTGKYSASWGGASAEGSRKITFDNNSISYNFYQKCGIPCKESSSISAKK